MEVNKQNYFQSFKCPSNILRDFTAPACPTYESAGFSYFHQSNDSNAQMLSFRFSEENSSFNDSADQVGSEYDMRDTLQSVVNPHLCKCCQSCHLFPEERQSEYPGNRAARPGTQKSTVCEDVRDCHTSNSSLELSISSKQDKQCSESTGFVTDQSVRQNASYGAPQELRKNRMRWTQELHRKFIDCVDCLGGAKKATPKAILKLMGSEGLTIFHVKSHLQKYRIGMYMPEHVTGGSEKTSKTDVLQLCTRSNMQMKEALQLQQDCEKHLREQQEIQQNLQRLIEEQSKQLKNLIEQNANKNLSVRT